MKSWIALALLAVAGVADAQQRVLFDTDRGPILIELDQTRAPNTSTNFLRYVDADRYDNTLLYRVVKDFIIQGGGYKEDSTPVERFPNIATERNNGLFNTPGTIAMALANLQTGQPDTSSANVDYFFNMATNTALDPNFTVFGKVVYGLGTLAAINPVTTRPNENNLPIRPPVIKRAVRVAAGAFPILDLHTGGWYDPAKPGKGFNIEIVQGGGDSTPTLVAYWFDFQEGKQIWMGGAAPFQWGAHEVSVPLQISQGGSFGPNFDPAAITTNPNWGTLTVRFPACDRATLAYTSELGNGTFDLRRLTLPIGARCTAN
jgi:peptidyl-prolyl cis-trans isomerase A (cyclophilin A)